MMNGLLLVILLIGTMGDSTYAYPEAYGPFEKGEFPDRVQMRECVLLSLGGQREKQPAGMFFSESQNPESPVVVLRRAENECLYRVWHITIIGKGGKTMSATTTNDSPSDFIAVRTADLNQDGQPDFVVNIGWCGCGLAASGSTVTFLLSSNGWYIGSNFSNYDFGPEDIVRFDPKGPYYYISNDFYRVGGDKTRDGRRHNFWVYQLYRFSGCQMIETGNVTKRFPKWVWYSFRENHRETDLLTADQKRSLCEPP